jgi:hypothetical protein
MASDDQDYGKKGDTKHMGTEKLEMISAGGSGSSGGTGPTGSKRDYPKGKGVKHDTDWNPQKMPASTYGINGVKCD